MSAREELKSGILNKAVVHGKVIHSSEKEAYYYVDLRHVTLDSTAASILKVVKNQPRNVLTKKMHKSNPYLGVKTSGFSDGLIQRSIAETKVG